MLAVVKITANVEVQHRQHPDIADAAVGRLIGQTALESLEDFLMGGAQAQQVGLAVAGDRQHGFGCDMRLYPRPEPGDGHDGVEMF